MHCHLYAQLICKVLIKYFWKCRESVRGSFGIESFGITHPHRTKLLNFTAFIQGDIILYLNNIYFTSSSILTLYISISVQQVSNR